jgi:hypothetical protein
MTDTAVTTPAPAGGGSSPAPGGEVVINPNPTSSPQPIGSQAPDKPVGDIQGGKGRPESRREAIEKAFKRAQEGDTAPKKPAAARPPAKKAADKTEAPAKEPAAKTGPYREGGKFARDPAKAAPGQDPGAQQQRGDTAQQQQQPAQRHAPLAADAPFRDPPPRMSDHAKADWAGAPESVRGEVHRMAQEFDGAYRKYRGDHETMNSIRHFHDMATQHGTTLDRALSNYVGMEQRLRADPIAGLDLIVSNLNLRTSDGHKINLRDVAYHVLSQTPDQLKATQASNAQNASQHQIGQLMQTVQSLANTVGQMQYDGQFRQTRSAVDQFADTHPGFDELGGAIEQELQHGYSLEEAYQRAALLNPNVATRAAQTRDDPSAQTRTDRSISGAPAGAASNASNQSRPKTGKQVGRREAIQRAIQRVNGSV